jgi:Zn ribbon nucleic-acid-binding protein
MEIRLDIGKNSYNDLMKNAKQESLAFEDFTINMLELGLRVFKASKEPKTDADDSLRLLMENNQMLKESIRCVFDKAKIEAKVFDAETLLAYIQNGVDNYLKGKGG